jgi:hypothetical protein
MASATFRGDVCGKIPNCGVRKEFVKGASPRKFQAAPDRLLIGLSIYLLYREKNCYCSSRDLARRNDRAG